MNEIVVVSTPSFSGGGLRAFRAIKAYSKVFRTNLFLPPSWENLMSADERALFVDRLKKLVAENVCIIGYACTQRTPLDDILKNVLHLKFKGIREFLPPRMRFIVNVSNLKPNLILTLHEDCNALYTAVKIVKIFGVKSLAILQLPPFYYSKSRVKKMYAAYELWLDVQYKDSFFKKMLCFHMTDS